MPLLGSVTWAELSLIAGPSWPVAAQPAARHVPSSAIAHAARRRQAQRGAAADVGELSMMTDLRWDTALRGTCPCVGHALAWDTPLRGTRPLRRTRRDHSLTLQSHAARQSPTWCSSVAPVV